MSSGYVQVPMCLTCDDSDLVAYCSACKRRHCPKCKKRALLGNYGYGEMCLDCFKIEFEARVDSARGKP